MRFFGAFFVDGDAAAFADFAATDFLPFSPDPAALPVADFFAAVDVFLLVLLCAGVFFGRDAVDLDVDFFFERVVFFDRALFLAADDFPVEVFFREVVFLEREAAAFFFEDDAEVFLRVVGFFLGWSPAFFRVVFLATTACLALQGKCVSACQAVTCVERAQ